MYTLEAVKEIWRVLKPDGILCDIHPYNAFVPFEIVNGGQYTPIATLDRSAAIEGVKIAHIALGIACHEGYFHLEKEDSFVSYRYWDTVEQVKDFYDDSSHVTLSDEVIEKARSMLAIMGKKAQLAVQRLYLIGAYRKL